MYITLPSHPPRSCTPKGKLASADDHQSGKYTVQVRSELSTGETMDVDESKVRELKVSGQNAEACPVVGQK
jgi:hypothetical protein